MGQRIFSLCNWNVTVCSGPSSDDVEVLDVLLMVTIIAYENSLYRSLVLPTAARVPGGPERRKGNEYYPKGCFQAPPLLQLLVELRGPRKSFVTMESGKVGKEVSNGESTFSG